MIQLNTNSLFGTQDQSSSAPASSGVPDTAGFQTALQQAISSTLEEFGINPNQVTVSIAPAGSTTASTAASTSATAATDPFSAAAAAGKSGATTSAAATPAATTPAATTPAATTPAATSDTSSNDSTQAFDDAYWAAQPPAVQALRTMDNYEQRTQLASELSAQGYKVDVPIMVWGWDPAKITAARQSYGYTWVPSATQANVAEAPGIKLPGMTAYDPNNPPAGSIAV
jgi:hypothetical protein